ncbi:hypothetical protein Dimus_012349 [Dionaea muscipula]
MQIEVGACQHLLGEEGTANTGSRSQISNCSGFQQQPTFDFRSLVHVSAPYIYSGALITSAHLVFSLLSRFWAIILVTICQREGDSIKRVQGILLSLHLFFRGFDHYLVICWEQS